MLETLLFAFIKGVLFLKSMRPFLESRLRGWEKKKLLGTLDRLRRKTFNERATDALVSAERIFDVVGGKKILRIRYIARLAAMGALAGLLLSMFALSFVVVDGAQFLRMLRMEAWRSLVIWPAIGTGAILYPLDFSAAHGLVRWGVKNPAQRSTVALVLGLPLAYLLWGIGTGIAACIGLFVQAEFFMLDFVANRIWVALCNPVTSAGAMQLNSTAFTYGLLSASVGLSTLIATIIFLVTSLLSRFPKELQILISRPFFWALGFINLLDRRNVNVPLGKITWSLLVILFLLLLIIR